MQASDARAVARRTRRIHGWFSPDAAALFGLLDEIQRTKGISGALFEIGAHHGRSTTMLCAMGGAGATVGVCDLFGRQDANISQSGAGDRRIFERNIVEHDCGAVIEIFEKSSADLRVDELGGPYRVFHVDGGHMLGEALADFTLAADVLDERGVIVVDDPFRPEWPGVTEAILQFCHERDDFAPLLMGFNKLVLMRHRAREEYEPMLLAEEWSYFDERIVARKGLPICGHRTHIEFRRSSRRIDESDRAIARVRFGWTAVRSRR